MYAILRAFLERKNETCYSRVAIVMTDRQLRSIFGSLSFISFFLIVASFYFEYIRDMQPCPLCLMQRISVMAVFFLCLLGFLFKKARCFSGLSWFLAFFALAGLYFSLRQLWIQTLSPEDLPACLPGLDVLIRYFPWQKTLHALFWGSSSCGEVEVLFLGQSMPFWTALYFSLLFVVALILLYLQRALNQSQPFWNKSH